MNHWDTPVAPNSGGKCGHGMDLFTCPICAFPRYAVYQPPVPVPTISLIGCVCPVGANKECENPCCPRKNPYPLNPPLT